MELIKVTNVQLKISETAIVPLICARVRASSVGNMTGAEWETLIRQVAEQSIGLTSLCAAYLRGDFLDGYTAGTNYLASTAGAFSLGMRCQSATSTAQSFNYTVSDVTGVLGLRYGALKCGTARVLTGYSNYEYGVMILFLTEDNRVIYADTGGGELSGFNLRMSVSAGASKVGQFVSVTIAADQLIYVHDANNKAPRIGDDVSAWIVSEYDPTQKDPYAGGGYSGPGGGSGGHSDTTDPIDFPALPSLSAASTGFITLYNPSLAQLQSLASYMWSNLFDVATFQKIFADPMDAILGLSIVPVDVPAGATTEVKVGNIGTGINLTKAASQYVEVDCGSINVEEFWGAYLDWAPYTKAELYLPYCGIHPISIDDIMGKTVAIKYHVDILSGSCVAYVKCGTSVLYSFAGQCSSSIPVNATSWAGMITGALSIAAAVGSMVASGGATAPMVAGSVGIASTAVNSLKPTVERSGSMSGTAGLLNLQTPYLILTRPRQALPERQNTFTGYPAFITAVLGDLEGWTTVSEIHLEGVPCTEAEASEILQLLKTGVIL